MIDGNLVCFFNYFTVSLLGNLLYRVGVYCLGEIGVLYVIFSESYSLVSSNEDSFFFCRILYVD